MIHSVWIVDTHGVYDYLIDFKEEPMNVGSMNEEERAVAIAAVGAVGLLVALLLGALGLTYWGIYL
jgi:hypothetical protein